MASTTAATSRPAPPPVPSHSTFLRAQIRSSLAHLRATSDIDSATFQQIDALLTNGAAASSPPSQSEGSQKRNESEEERQLGANNAWLRKMLIETSLLSDTVGLALTVAVPSGLLGSAQRQSIIELVEVSKVKVANAITDPSVQKKTTLGAKSAHAGIRKGISAASQSVGELSRKREEAKSKAEAKKADKQEKKAMKEELKREREEIVRQRQTEMLGPPSGDASLSDAPKSTRSSADITAPARTAATAYAMSPDQSISLSEAEAKAEPDATDVDGDAMVSVTCSQLSPQGSVAATTTFSPWPGLLLTSTLVASYDEGSESSDEDDSSSRYQESSAVITPPPRRAPPAPSSQGSHGAASQDGPSHPQPVERVFSRQVVPTASPSTTQFEDVTEAKQKSWTRKLGI